MPFGAHTLWVMSCALPVLHRSFLPSVCAVHQQGWYSGWLAGGTVVPLPLCSESLSLCAQKKKGTFTAAWRPEGCWHLLPSSCSSLNPSSPSPIPSIPASDPSWCFWVRTVLPTASLLPLFTYTPPGTVGVTTSPGFFCFQGSHWFLLLDCRHSICFLIVSSAHEEWAMFLGAALCGVSPPTAERLPCCIASACQHLPSQWLRLGNRTSS